MNSLQISNAPVLWHFFPNIQFNSIHSATPKTHSLHSGRISRPMASTRTLSDPTLDLQSNSKLNQHQNASLHYETGGSDRSRSSSFHARPNSPATPTRSRLAAAEAASFWDLKVKKRRAAKAWHSRKRVKGAVALIGLVALFFFVNWIMLLRLQDRRPDPDSNTRVSENSVLVQVCYEISI